MSLNSNHDEANVVFESNPYYSTLSLDSTRNIKTYLKLKRAVDIILAGSGLIMISPILLLLAVMIKLEDPKGPVFFSQIRLGKGEKPFRMFKFRSMVSNAEDLLSGLLEQNDIQGAMFKMKEDPRITKVGKWIRRTSLDELPQLWNVLRGEMSLVGPRPPLPRELEDYSSYDKQRLRVTPGCTGLWQISGRNDLDFDQMVELDLRYIQERSISMDIGIIMKTIKMLTGSKGAY